ncbi:elongator complex protein 5 [Salvia miltiorrhiza]|uniref:elongator complex protein 5 n=1 Tax=Salvia miltiorrhiza TaxID=226208 RepID=UPI0025ABAE99|nr:elongator complex protein 5 [Salvia miltiorrhiza]XP_057784138.1 elongator complex protein 5 [Salvia miltiorrhiza]XP_057784139.1 elongator complex protein 5 [Salvia miltiorrhiza]
MAEWICRTLRDGGLEGEHAPALTINDTITCSLGSFVFDHILSQLSSFIDSQKSLSSGIVLVALSRSPLYYEKLLKSKGYDVSTSTWFKVLDCYTDPLGWKSKLMNNGSIANDSLGSSVTVKLCKNVKDLDGLLSLILQLGKELSADGKGRFVVAIDSVSEMLRHASVSSVASLLSELRSHGQVSSLFWLLHSDLHESRATAALEYMSSMKATLEQMVQPVDGLRGNSVSLSLMEHNLRRGKFSVHVKRRNGRVRMMVEELYVENSNLNFTPFSTADEVTAQSLVPKVQFNLQLSEKERNDRAKVVLPFEHQGNGKNIQIYDGRKSLDESKGYTEQIGVEKEEGRRGEIIYFRDSDDEMPDSDEDPDDDLDI